MARRRLLIFPRAILAGWMTLLAIAYLLERPLLHWTEPILGSEWISTARLTLDCCAFAATGWVTGRWNRPNSLLAVLVFAATLTVWDFTPLLPVDVPWLLHLMVNTLRDSRYLESLFTTAANLALLFGCLIAGGLLARPRQPFASIRPY